MSFLVRKTVSGMQHKVEINPAGFTQDHKSKLALKSKYEQETCDYIMKNKLVFQVELENRDNSHRKSANCLFVISCENKPFNRQYFLQRVLLYEQVQQCSRLLQKQTKQN